MYEIHKTKLNGCIELIPKSFVDNRGITIKPFHKKTFEELGLEGCFEEDLMVTSQKGVLRGLHMQSPPFQQAKLLYCVRGSIFDVAVDVRKESPSYGKYVSFFVDARRNNMIYIPAGFAHGYQVLEESTTVIYKMTSIYSPEHEAGIQWNSVGIQWPLSEPILSEKDKVLPKLKDFVSPF